MADIHIIEIVPVVIERHPAIQTFSVMSNFLSRATRVLYRLLQEPVGRSPLLLDLRGRSYFSNCFSFVCGQARISNLHFVNTCRFFANNGPLMKWNLAIYESEIYPRLACIQPRIKFHKDKHNDNVQLQLSLRKLMFSSSIKKL